MVSAFLNIGLAFENAKRLDEAGQSYEEAELLSRETGDARAESRAIASRARLAFNSERYEDALLLFREAEERAGPNDDERHDALTGLLETVSVRGVEDQLQPVAQRVVTLSQRARLEIDGSVAVARSARWWLSRAQLEEAQSLYAVAMVLAASAATNQGTLDPLSSEQAQTLLWPVALMVMHVQEELTQPNEEDAFYEAVFEALDRDYQGIGEHLRFLLEVALEGAREPK
jgi:tetratricopeptide (TPR) repeat protein